MKRLYTRISRPPEVLVTISYTNCHNRTQNFFIFYECIMQPYVAVSVSQTSKSILMLAVGTTKDCCCKDPPPQPCPFQNKKKIYHILDPFWSHDHFSLCCDICTSAAAVCSDNFFSSENLHPFFYSRLFNVHVIKSLTE